MTRVMTSNRAHGEPGWQVCDWRDEGELHVIPSYGEEHRRHFCWCRPEEHVASKDVVPITIYVHRVKQ